MGSRPNTTHGSRSAGAKESCNSRFSLRAQERRVWGIGLVPHMDRVPQALRSRVTVLSRRGSHDIDKKIFLLGTAHLSKRSEDDVHELVKATRPSDIFVELCGARSDILYRDQKQNFKKFGPKEFLKAFKQNEGNIFALGYAYMLHSLGNELDLVPGAEFRASYLAGKENNANIILGDREVGTTIYRVWNGLDWGERLKLFYKVFVQGDDFLGEVGSSDQSNEDLKRHIDNLAESVDLRLIFEEMDKSFPWLVESLLRERDQVMGIHLKQLMRPADEWKSKSWPPNEVQGDVVAVVGAAHVEGIVKEWLTERSPREDQELLRIISSCVVKKTADKEKRKGVEGKLVEDKEENEYEGIPGYTKADLRKYVANFKRNHTDVQTRSRLKHDRELFSKYKGVMYESEKDFKLGH